MVMERRGRLIKSEYNIRAELFLYLYGGLRVQVMFFAAIIEVYARSVTRTRFFSSVPPDETSLARSLFPYHAPRNAETEYLKTAAVRHYWAIPPH